MKFIWKKDVSAPSEDHVEVTAEVYALIEVKQTSFGAYRPTPSLPLLFDFLGVKYLLTGHGNYNGLGLSTQVPARYQYVLNKPVDLTHPQLKNMTILVVDPTIPFELTQAEYAFYDAFVNYDSIIFDGYFNSVKALLEGTYKKFKDSGLNSASLKAKILAKRPEIKDLVAQW